MNVVTAPLVLFFLPKFFFLSYIFSYDSRFKQFICRTVPPPPPLALLS